MLARIAHACARTNAHVCTHTHTHTHTRARTCARTHVRAHARARTRTHTHARTHTHTHACMRTCHAVSCDCAYRVTQRVQRLLESSLPAAEMTHVVIGRMLHLAHDARTHTIRRDNYSITSNMVHDQQRQPAVLSSPTRPAGAVAITTANSRQDYHRKHQLQRRQHAVHAGSRPSRPTAELLYCSNAARPPRCCWSARRSARKLGKSTAQAKRQWRCQQVRRQAPSLCLPHPKPVHAALRLWPPQPRRGGAACAALLWRRRARAS